MTQSFKAVGLEYAERIRAAVRTDTAHGRLSSPDSFRSSDTLAELKEISRELDMLVESTTNKPLSDQDKRTILEHTDADLRLRPGQSRDFIKAASNDQIADVLDKIDQLLNS